VHGREERSDVMDLTVRDHALDAARRPVVVLPDDTLRVVACRLWEAAVGAAVVVTDTDDVIGIISERDVVSQLAMEADPDETTAQEAMSRVVVSVRPEDPLLDVVFLMIDALVRHVPVITEDGEIDGMVSIRDVLRPLLVDKLGGTTTTVEATAS
jgi:CBS domain-containing protein